MEAINIVVCSNNKKSIVVVIYNMVTMGVMIAESDLTNLLGWNPQGYCSQVHFLVRLNAREYKEYSYKKHTLSIASR